MTDWVAELTEETNDIVSTTWDVREGRVVPESEDIALADGAVKINATFLYADLAGSSQLAQSCPWPTTAKLIRAYLHCATRLIRGWRGHIRSFDGDRVMGVFIGPDQHSDAVRCAREISYSTLYIINPAAKRFKSIRDANIEIRQCVGVDTGEAIGVRAGIRNNNDVIWIGRAPSLAAKLSDVRTYPFCTYVSSTTFYHLAAPDRAYDGKNLWQSCSFTFGGADLTVYRTNWWRRP